MGDHQQLRNRFEFGAPPSWTSADTNSDVGTTGTTPTRSLPGSYIPDDPVDEIPLNPDNVATPPPFPPQRPRQNREKTCRICLSGAEDGALSFISDSYRQAV